MNNLLEILIPKANAQTTDATSQPTFGPIDVGGSGTTSASISVSSSKTAVVVGETFTVRVEVKTNNIEIEEYRLVIDFDPALLSVVDQDNATQGTQVRLLDQVFTIANPSQDNSVASVGRIRVNAASPNGVPLTVNTQVVEIQFQALNTGDTSVQVVSGVTGSQLVREAGIGLSYNRNEVPIEISTTTGNNDDDDDDEIPVDDGNSGNGNGTTNPPTLPNTAISNDLSVIVTVLFGVCLMILGIVLKSGGEEKKKGIKNLRKGERI